MALQEGLATYLKAQTPISDVVGSKVYPDKAPQGTDPPYLVLILFGHEAVHDSTGSSGLHQSFITIECHSRVSYKQARDLAELVRLETQGYSGTWGSEQIRAALLENMKSISQLPADGGEIGRPIVSVDLAVWHTETIPSF